MLLLSYIVLTILPTPILLPQIEVHGAPTNDVHSTSHQSGNSWSNLSDILDLSQIDMNWQAEVDSGIKSGNGNFEQTQTSNEKQTSSGKRKRPYKKRIRNSLEDKIKQKGYRQSYKARVQSNPEIYEQLKAKKKEWNVSSRIRMMSQMTESEREAYKLRKKQAKRDYRLSVKAKYDGFSSAKAQRLNTIRKMKLQGKASEQDLKFLHDEQEKNRKAYARRREAKKGT